METASPAPALGSCSPNLTQLIVEHNHELAAGDSANKDSTGINHTATPGSGRIEMEASEKTAEILSPPSGIEGRDEQSHNESSPSCTATDSEQRPSPTSELRSSVSSLQGNKGRYHIQRGAAIGKHMNGRVVGRACKLVHIEAVVDAISPNSLSSPRVLRSPRRKKSPIRWFPRTKTESYLERKIRMIQEKEGTVASLDETLGASSLHLSRIEREKLAVQAAATDAMTARKAALIEASWCRILRLASIPCNSATLELRKAEKKASEALDAAANLGVILRNGHDSPKNLVDLEPASGAGQTVTASLDTAFDVDKEVTAAIKIALLNISLQAGGDVKNVIDARFETKNRRLQQELRIDNRFSGNTSGESQAEIESGVGTGRQNINAHTSPVEGDCLHLEVDSDCMIEISSEVESEPELEFQSKESSGFKKQESSKLHPTNRGDKSGIPDALIELMIKRIEGLGVEEHVSLAGLVATRGLGALLQEQTLEQELNEKILPTGDTDENVSRQMSEAGALGSDGVPRRVSSPKKASDLGSILVKHVPRFQKEMQAAKEMAILAQVEVDNKSAGCQTQHKPEIESLDKVLVKHVSRLEKERLAAQAAASCIVQDSSKTSSVVAEEGIPPLADKPEIESLDKVLVKHVSRLEKERAAAAQAAASYRVQDSSKDFKNSSVVAEEAIPSLADILKKPPGRIKHGLPEDAQENDTQNCFKGERKMLSDLTNKSSSQADTAISEELIATLSANNIPKKNQNLNCENIPDLGSILVKHVSRLERDKQAALRLQGQSYISSKKVQSKQACDPGLDEILVKRMSRLEKEKSDASGKDKSLEVETSLEHTAVQNDSQESFDERNPSDRIFNDCNGMDCSALDQATLTVNPSLAQKLTVERPSFPWQAGNEATSTAAEPKNGAWQKRKSATARQIEEAWGGLDLQKAMQSGLSHNCRQAQMGKPSFKLMVNNKTPVISSPQNDISLHRKQSIRDRQIQEEWGGLSLGNALKPHVSKLERDQAAWKQAEQDAATSNAHRH